jgi:hypothetical protein
MSTWWPSWILGGTMVFRKESSGPQQTKKISGKSKQMFLSYSTETKAERMYIGLHVQHLLQEASFKGAVTAILAGKAGCPVLFWRTLGGVFDIELRAEHQLGQTLLAP